MEKPGVTVESNINKKEEASSRRDFLKKLAVLTAGTLFFGSKAFAETNQQQQSLETEKLENPRLEKMQDHNLPKGFERKHIFAELAGVKTNVASAFFFEAGKTNATLLSNDLHPECFSPEINYKKVQDSLQKKGKELVVAFAGAYRSPTGNIEGIAYENGVSVGESTYSKWHGFVSLSKDGNIELHRMKDAQGNFDQVRADALVQKTKAEQGSLFQQIPAIWNGVQKFEPKKPDLYEMRALCESKDGKKFMINCTEKITQDAFLKMCLGLKDENGNQAVWNLMLTDTGECSLAVFRDSKQILEDNQTGSFSKHTMVDERFAGNKNGFTNLVVVSN